MTAERTEGTYVSPDEVRIADTRVAGAVPSRSLTSNFKSTDFVAGDIVRVVVPRLDTAGHEQWGDRPWVVNSSRTLHDRDLGLVIAVPCTQHSSEAAFRAARVRVLRSDIDITGDLRDEDQLVLTEHVRSLSVQRITAKAGRVKSKKTINLLRGAVATLIDVDCDEG